jgi:uridine kinase
LKSNQRRFSEFLCKFRQASATNEQNGEQFLQGIFLFKQAYRSLFDLAIWVDCTFATALARALQRAQEGLPLAETIAAYETIYFPAQRIHLDQDNPRGSADLILDNDFCSARRFSNFGSHQVNTRSYVAA